MKSSNFYFDLLPKHKKSFYLHDGDTIYMESTQLYDFETRFYYWVVIFFRLGHKGHDTFNTTR